MRARSLKFATYPVARQTQSVNQFISPMVSNGVITLNSFAAFADSPLPDTARWQPGGDIYTSVNNTYGPDVANQTAAAANNGDQPGISAILGSAIPLGQPGGGSIQPDLDESTSDALWSQLYNDPLGAPIEQANKILTSTGNTVASSTGITKLLVIAGVGGLLYLMFAKK